MLEQQMSVDDLARTTMLVTVAVIVASVAIGVLLRRVMKRAQREATDRKKSDGE